MSTALYRRYRPDTFDDVIGQDHVTTPLRAALKANKVSHAYLFSGPRGCGKTTSARILARCLNCAQGPTDTPCGQCDSCRELATGGPGSLDVVEMDAASHGGVDDARDLRERAAFAPVRDRFKIFIIDEAHMVTSQGFNALLKLVEEPPDHIKFIFATTEPDKVLNTIRSRTHHYPFRLVPPDVMQPFLQHMCDLEHVQVDDGVLGLVMRAGGGSVRDTLSVLDQLMAGAVDGALNYQQTVALLGYTDIALLDQTVDALAGGDGAAVYRVIERTVDSGHDPRRFVEDFLQRLRDLLILAVAGDQASQVLTGIPVDQLQRMQVQARSWGGPALSRAADLADQALRTMVGATSPRLQLELLIGRILVPSQVADISIPQGAKAQLGPVPGSVGRVGGGAPVPASAPTANGRGSQAFGSDDHFGAKEAKELYQREKRRNQQTSRASVGSDTADEPQTPDQSDWGSPNTRPAPDQRRPSARSSDLADRSPVPGRQAGPMRANQGTNGQQAAESQPTNEQVTDQEAQAETEARGRQPEGGQQRQGQTTAQARQQGEMADLIRQKWPEIVDRLERVSRMAWIMLSHDGQLGAVTEQNVVVLLPSQGAVANFEQHGRARDVEQVIRDATGLAVRVHAQVAQAGGGAAVSTPGATANRPADRAPEGKGLDRSGPQTLNAEGTGPHRSPSPNTSGSKTPAFETRRHDAPAGNATQSVQTSGLGASQHAEIEPSGWTEPVVPVPAGGEDLADLEDVWPEPVAPIPFGEEAGGPPPGGTEQARLSDWSKPAARSPQQEREPEPQPWAETEPRPDIQHNPEPGPELEPGPEPEPEPERKSVSQPGPHWQPGNDNQPPGQPVTDQAPHQPTKLEQEQAASSSQLHSQPQPFNSTFRAGPGGRTLQVVSNDEPELEEEPQVEERPASATTQPGAESEPPPELAPEPEPETETQARPRVQAAEDESASPDDADATVAPNIGLPAVLSILGGKVIEEKEE